MSSIYQTLQCTSCILSQGVGVLFCASVQAVQKSMQNHMPPVLLPYQNHHIAPGTLARLDSTRLQHLPQVVPNLLNQWWGNLSKSFLKGIVICYFCHVFHRVGTAQFHWIQQEHVVVFGQEPGGQHLPSLGVQETNSLKSNSLNSLPCLCLTVNLGVWGPWGSLHPLLQLDLHRWFGHQVVLPLPWPLGFSSGRYVSKPCCSLPQ